MRHLFFAAVSAASLALAAPSIGHAASGQAAIGTTGGGITLVAGGCGPHRFRAANGYCYPIRRPPPPRRYHRPCPVGWHPTPYGCRRNY